MRLFLRDPVWRRRLMWGGLASVLLAFAFFAFVAFPFFANLIESPDEATPVGESETLGEDLPIDLGIDLPENTSPIDIDQLPDQLLIEIPGLGIELPRLTDEEEVEIGRESAAEFESQNPISSDPALANRVTRIGNSIVPYQPRTEIPYTFKVIDTSEINAFALPGGFIYISRGMLEFVESDDELAGVIGHEIAHVALRHSAQQIEAIVTGQMALEAVLSGNSELESIYQDQSVQIATEMVGMIALRGWGRMNELDADEYGTVYMAHAGYDPQAVLALMQRFESQTHDVPGDPMGPLLATHPPFNDRIERVEIAISKHGLS
jgi:predicted Zn-dependent protease